MAKNMYRNILTNFLTIFMVDNPAFIALNI